MGSEQSRTMVTPNDRQPPLQPSARVFRVLCFLFTLILMGIALEGLSLQPILDVTFSKIKEGKPRVVLFAENQAGIPVSKRRQLKALAALKRLEQRFDTRLTSKHSVLESGFPFTWQECTLVNAMQQKGDPKKPLQFVLLGGSSSARPASNCRGEEHPEDARFSNILESNLHSSFGDLLDFEVINHSQGSENSAWFGLHLNELVDPNEADVLIWEGCINDIYSAKERLFELWLARVDALYTSAKRQRPPILFLCLWPARSGERLDQVANGGLLGAPMIAASHYLKYYQSPQHGWNIQAIGVGGTIDGPTLAQNPKLLFDDDHHPSCLGVELISDMLQHAIYTDLATCDSDQGSLETSVARSSDFETDMHTPPSRSIDKEEHLETWIKDLWNLFLRKDVRVGSISPWEPNAKTTALNMANVEEVRDFPSAYYHPVEPGRTDRKKNYILPLCTSGALQFTLLEPTLEWLGIGIKKAKAAEIKINGIPIALKKNNAVMNNRLQVNHIQTWMHIPSAVPLSKIYTISICQSDDQNDPRLNQLVGVMMPDLAS